MEARRVYTAIESGDAATCIDILGKLRNVHMRNHWTDEYSLTLEDDTPLIAAARKGLIEVCEYVLERRGKAAVDLHNACGDTALIVAAKGGYIELCRLLLEHKADLNKVSHAGHSALFAAVLSGEELLCSLFLEAGANPDVTDCLGETPLSSAAARGDVDMSRLLLRHDAEPVSQGTSGMTPLIYAARSGHVELVRMLAASNHSNVNVKDLAGNTALHVAAEYGCHISCEVLLHYGADASVLNNRKKMPAEVAVVEQVRSVLERAALDGEGLLRSGTSSYIGTSYAASHPTQPLFDEINDHNATKAMRLINDGVPINRRCGFQRRYDWSIAPGDTPLIAAARMAMPDVCMLLLSREADVNACNHRGQSALHTAALRGLLEVCRALIDAGAAANPAEPARLWAYCATPLHLAAQESHTEVCRLLLEHGADVNAATAWGEAPVHFAIRAGCHPVFELFLCADCSENTTNRDGVTPLILAAKLGRESMCLALLERFPLLNLHARDTSGWTAMFWASRHGLITTCLVLHERGAEVNVQDSVRNTPLMVMAMHSHSPRKLFRMAQMGSDPRQRNDWGESALQFVSQSHHAKLINGGLSPQGTPTKKPSARVSPTKPTPVP
eukprot:TRINITY_DN27246_c0_g1_i1.p1 TRINITY_DN27246_c0_g1~~TRINITY_DN27246_c0_g1_i1.p1  ORF type:complete len:615 (+),score=91.78 TRINITY_DN27246_c0_g1_i1:57-1901(+)